MYTPIPEEKVSEDVTKALRGLKNSTRSAALAVGRHLSTVASNGGDQSDAEFLAEEAEILSQVASKTAADLRGEEKEDLGSQALNEPLSEEEKRRVLEETENGRVSEVVKVHMSTFERAEVDGILKHLSRAVIGSSLLMEINYEVVGVANAASIYVRVTGLLPEDEVLDLSATEEG